MHVHVLHPDGKALVTLDGTTINSGVPVKTLKAAQDWVAANADLVRAEWLRVNNPARKTP